MLEADPFAARQALGGLEILKGDDHAEHGDVIEQQHIQYHGQREEHQHGVLEPL